MLDFAGAIQTAYDYVQKTYTVHLLSQEEKGAVSFGHVDTVWRVEAHYIVGDGITNSVTLLVAFPDDFPLVLPQVYILEEDLKKIQFIPHVDSIGYVCLFDTTSISLDSSRPGEIVVACLNKAIVVIEQGLSGNNVGDYADEFIAYWAEMYSDSDKIEVGLSLVNQFDTTSPHSVNLIVLDKAYGSFCYILVDENQDSTRFKKFLSQRKYTYKSADVFYLGTTSDLVPPFPLTNSDLATLITAKFPDKSRNFSQFLNRTVGPVIVMCSVSDGDNVIFVGWQIAGLKCKRNGFRNSILARYDVLSTFQKKDQVHRIRFENFTNGRLSTRTAGVKPNRHFKLSIAGIGSIGSNLIPYLLPLEIDYFVLIDKDTLNVENVHRHLLGLNYVGFKKVDAVKNFIESSNPLINVVSIKKSIATVIKNDARTLNECDYNFVCIGLNNIEEFIVQSLKEGILIKPTFIIWIEPFLIGGHCLYFSPGHNIEYATLFNDGHFKNNLIAEEEYRSKSRELTFREAGCQTSYIPYGQRSVIAFLSKLSEFIYSAMEGDSKSNVQISWRNTYPGDLASDIKLSAFGKDMLPGELKILDLS